MVSLKSNEAFHDICSINRQDKNGECAMIVICKMGWLSLLEKVHSIETIDINVTDNEGNTPLIHAAQVECIFNMKIVENEHIHFQPLSHSSALSCHGSRY